MDAVDELNLLLGIGPQRPRLPITIQRSGYAAVRVLGKGSFGSAYLVFHAEKNSYFVVKHVDMTAMSKKQRSDARNEIKVLQQLQHPNIIRYVEFCEEFPHLYIVMEYADGGDLFSHLKKIKQSQLFRGGPSRPSVDAGRGANGSLGVPSPAQRSAPFGHLTEDQVLSLFVQVTMAVKYMHDRRLLHRDIKSQNVFITSSHVVKLGDFGISTILKNTLAMAETMCGTPSYFSPELCLGKSYNNKSDVWALGVLLYELASGGKLPYEETTSIKRLMNDIVNKEPKELNSYYSPELRKLVKALLRKDPARRPDADGILKTPLILRAMPRIMAQLAESASMQPLMMSSPRASPHAPAPPPRQNPYLLQQQQQQNGHSSALANVNGGKQSPCKVFRVPASPKKQALAESINWNTPILKDSPTEQRTNVPVLPIIRSPDAPRLERHPSSKEQSDAQPKTTEGLATWWRRRRDEVLRGETDGQHSSDAAVVSPPKAASLKSVEPLPFKAPQSIKQMSGAHLSLEALSPSTPPVAAVAAKNASNEPAASSMKDYTAVLPPLERRANPRSQASVKLEEYYRQLTQGKDRSSSDAVQEPSVPQLESSENGHARELDDEAVQHGSVDFKQMMARMKHVVDYGSREASPRRSHVTSDPSPNQLTSPKRKNAPKLSTEQIEQALTDNRRSSQSDDAPDTPSPAKGAEFFEDPYGVAVDLDTLRARKANVAPASPALLSRTQWLRKKIGNIQIPRGNGGRSNSRNSDALHSIRKQSTGTPSNIEDRRAPEKPIATSAGAAAAIGISPPSPVGFKNHPVRKDSLLHEKAKQGAWEVMGCEEVDIIVTPPQHKQSDEEDGVTQSTAGEADQATSSPREEEEEQQQQQDAVVGNPDDPEDVAFTGNCLCGLARFSGWLSAIYGSFICQCPLCVKMSGAFGGVEWLHLPGIQFADVMLQDDSACDSQSRRSGSNSLHHSLKRSIHGKDGRSPRAGGTPSDSQRRGNSDDDDNDEDDEDDGFFPVDLNSVELVVSSRYLAFEVPEGGTTFYSCVMCGSTLGSVHEGIDGCLLAKAALDEKSADILNAHEQVVVLDGEEEIVDERMDEYDDDSCTSPQEL